MPDTIPRPAPAVEVTDPAAQTWEPPLDLLDAVAELLLEGGRRPAPGKEGRTDG
jgi:hypothetical protein